MTTIRSIMPVHVPTRHGWNVRVRTDSGTLYLTTGAPYTLAQAEVAAANLHRDMARHGIAETCNGLLIGLV